jgi:hypothetical protein
MTLSELHRLYSGKLDDKYRKAKVIMACIKVLFQHVPGDCGGEVNRIAGCWAKNQTQITQIQIHNLVYVILTQNAYTLTCKMEKLEILPALHDVFCPWKTEGMDMPHQLSIAGNLQCVLYKITYHYHLLEPTNQSFPKGEEKVATKVIMTKITSLMKLIPLISQPNLNTKLNVDVQVTVFWVVMSCSNVLPPPLG